MDSIGYNIPHYSFAEMKIFDIAVEFKLSESDPSILAVGSGLFLIDILVYILMSRISRKNLERTQLLIDKMQLDVYKDRLTETQKQYNEIKSIRHDMKNHLQCILSLIKRPNMMNLRNMLKICWKINWILYINL